MDNNLNIACNFPVLETERLILRDFTESDYIDLFEIYSDEDITVHCGIFSFENLQQSKDLIQLYRSNYMEGKTIRWAIQHKETKKVIGSFGYHGWIKNHYKAEIGYQLNKEYWHKGYAVEALKEIIKYGQDTMDLRRIEAVVYPGNKPSEELLYKFGFEHEGLLRSYACFRNVQQDLNIFSLIRGF